MTEEPIRNGDVRIGDDALSVLEKNLVHGVEVLGAIVRLNPYDKLNDLIYRPAAAGYYEIQKEIREFNSIDIAHSSVQFTVKQLLRLGFLKLHLPPGFGSSAQYQSLTPRGMLAMLRGVNATHFRVYNSRTLLIAPPCGRPHVI